MLPEMGQAITKPTLDSSSDSSSDYWPDSPPGSSPDSSSDSSSDSSDMSVQHSRRRNLAWGRGEAGPSSPRRRAIAQVEEEPIIEPATGDEWEEYEPPAALQWAPNTTNEILIGILKTSVTNVRTSITERREREIREQEERERAEAERIEAERVEAEEVEAERVEAERVEAERVEAERTSRQEAKGKGKEPHLPVIVSARSGEDLLEAPLPYFAGNGEGPSTSRPAVLHVQPKKSRFSLRDMLRLRRPSKKYAPLSSRLSLRSGGSSSTTDIETPPDENTNTTASQPPINRPPAVVWVNPPEPSTDECVSCFEDFSPQEMIKVTCHSYCQECFDRLVRTATQNEQQWPPKCCLNVIPFRTVIRYASNDLHETYRNRSEEWSVPVADRVYCSQRDCNLWIRPARIDRIQHLGHCDADHQTCTICREPQHIGEECPRDPDVALTNELAREEGWQRCAQCRSIVEHSEACEHMSCRCGYQFCYVCGERWKTCECTIEDLNALKNQVLARRELRQVREAEAESELRDALRQIAEAEERERREEEERLRALALRVRWENQRRHEIGVSFRRLRRRLEELHNQQKGLVAYQHRRERYTSLQDASTSTEELAARQKAEMAEFNENKARNRVEWELWLQDDYNRRAQKDKKLEERYLRDLKDFANTRGRMENINEYMQVLRERLDRDARLFRQRQEEWLVRYKNKADEETAVKAEVLSNIVRWHEENLAEAKKEQERRQAAELRWVALVMDERARLMDEAENAELDALPEAVASFFGVPVVVDGVAVA